jgi:hypothetical protein
VVTPRGRDVAASFADDPELLGALSALAALGIGGIAVRLIEISLGVVCGTLSVREGWKGFRPARGRGENGNGLAERGLDGGDIVVQSCNEGLRCIIGKAGFVLLFSEALLCECDLADMSVSCGVCLEVEGSWFKPSAIGALG